MIRCLVAALAVVVSAGAQTAIPLDPQQTATLNSASRFALAYFKSLPDFLATEIVRRSEDPRGTNRWRSVDTLTIKVTYSGHEDYQLQLRNGHPVKDSDMHSAGGAISGGEFGSRLVQIFARESATAFTWKGWAHHRRRRVAVFAYHVDSQHSSNRISVSPANAPSMSTNAAFHGELSVDPDTGAIVRVTLSAELPPGFPITACSSWTEYDYREVAGKKYLLPVASETSMTQGMYLARNEIEFRDYRKFETESTLTFK